jgi:hypothetical protein
MSQQHPEQPLYLQLTDRRCRRLYLLLAHLLPAPVLLLAHIGLDEILLGLSLLFCSGLYWLWYEGSPQPKALSWDAERGWRLQQADGQKTIARPRALTLGPCLLLQCANQLYFLPQQSGLNRLRRLLRN